MIVDNSDICYSIVDESDIYYSIICRYLIEIGSGAGYKTVMFASEFRVIGVDFKSNVVLGRKLHPAMQFIDADLDVSEIRRKFSVSEFTLCQKKKS